MIHVSSPGLLVFSGILYAKLLDLPLVVSYHTHIPGKLFCCMPCGLSPPAFSDVTAGYNLPCSTHNGVRYTVDMLVTNSL